MYTQYNAQSNCQKVIQRDTLKNYNGIQLTQWEAGKREIKDRENKYKTKIKWQA